MLILFQNIKRYKRNLLENSFKILHKPSRAGSTSAILSTHNAENQPYGECTAHLYKVTFELCIIAGCAKIGIGKNDTKVIAFLESTIRTWKNAWWVMYTLAKKLEEYYTHALKKII
jgi:hypothetical protein